MKDIYEYDYEWIPKFVAFFRIHITVDKVTYFFQKKLC